MPDIAELPNGDSSNANGGKHWTLQPSGGVKSITIRSYRDRTGGWGIASLQINGSPQFGQGLPGESFSGMSNISVEPPEHFIGITGSYEQWKPPHGNSVKFMSLSFITNLGRVIPPKPQRTRTKDPNSSVYNFEQKTPDNSPILGVHGFISQDLRTGADGYISAIGIIRKDPSPPTPPPLPKPVLGTRWGTNDGQSWEFVPHKAITEIIVSDDNEVIRYLRFKTEDGRVSPKFGGVGGKEHTVPIKKGVTITGIEGTFGEWGSYVDVVPSLRFHTSDGKITQRFGKYSGTEFTDINHDSIIGFYGNQGLALNGIGVILQPKA